MPINPTGEDEKKDNKITIKNIPMLDILLPRLVDKPPRVHHWWLRAQRTLIDCAETKFNSVKTLSLNRKTHLWIRIQFLNSCVHSFKTRLQPRQLVAHQSTTNETERLLSNRVTQDDSQRLLQTSRARRRCARFSILVHYRRSLPYLQSTINLRFRFKTAGKVRCPPQSRGKRSYHETHDAKRQ